MSDPRRWEKSVADAICDGLTGWLMLQARKHMGAVSSEYLLYPTILEIGHARQWYVRCEVPVTYEEKRGSGDRKRIDFVIAPNRHSRHRLLLEVKFRKGTAASLSIANDVEKLRQESLVMDPHPIAVMIVAGRMSNKKRLSGKRKAGDGIGALISRSVFSSHGLTYGAEAHLVVQE